MDYVLNTPQFTQLCKTGFMTKQTPEGRSDLQFYSIDLIDLCNGKGVEKELYSEKYRFQVNGISNEDIKNCKTLGELYQMVDSK